MPMGHALCASCASYGSCLQEKTPWMEQGVKHCTQPMKIKKGKSNRVDSTCIVCHGWRWSCSFLSLFNYSRFSFFRLVHVSSSVILARSLFSFSPVPRTRPLTPGPYITPHFAPLSHNRTKQKMKDQKKTRIALCLSSSIRQAAQPHPSIQSRHGFSSVFY